MRKAVIISECKDCGNLILNSWIPPIWCEKAKRERSETIGIPDWCPLLDISSLQDLFDSIVCLADYLHELGNVDGIWRHKQGRLNKLSLLIQFILI